MQFTSIAFVVFFVAVYALYVLLRRRLRWQNLLLLAASLLFYGWWDWRFLALLLGSITFDWLLGLRLAGPADTRAQRRRWLAASLIGNLGLLGFFKYFNFFADSFAALARGLGWDPGPVTLHIILPMGISFYVFQSMSYTIDVWRGEIGPCRSWSDYALYVTFFPQLVAGPIERARTLLPQVQAPRAITVAGLQAAVWLLAWGFFKKMVVADNLAPVADAAFARDPALVAGPGPAMWLGAVAFMVQIYADFSGYSDIARGLSKMMGFDLMLNFRCPLLAENPSDFWRRWHISLSTWLRDYLYIPLGGNRAGPLRTHLNLLATMTLGGLWHGARWNFVLWGLYHGLLLILHRVLSERAGRLLDAWPRWLRLGSSIAVMTILGLIGWVLFRCESAAHIAEVAGLAFSAGGADAWRSLPVVAACTAPILFAEVLHQRTGDLLCVLRSPTAVQALAVGALLIAIGVWGVRSSETFIYFQF